MQVSLQCFGAARQVTGSKHLLQIGERRVLLDCGLVQGPRAIADQQNRELPFPAGSIEAVVLSHAHVDHSGSLPQLVSQGFAGPIHCTPATADLAALLLEDSARIQAQDAAHLARRGGEFEPYYDVAAVERTRRRFVRHSYRTPFELLPGIGCEFFDAGHILGSSMPVLRIDAGGPSLRIAFTGDHGRRGLPILRDPERLPEVDYLITEATYGDRLHEPRPQTLEALARIVDEEARDGGRILIPAFAVGRTQVLLHAFAQLVAAKRIPPQRIWVDSPLATKATQLVARYPELHDRELRSLIESGHDPFFPDGVRYVASADESKELNGLRSGVVIAASGMLEAGRILHHLDHSIGRPEDCVVALGFMAEGTLGRKLVDGLEHVRIFGERRAVRCKVRTLPGFSAHADWQELLASFAHLVPVVRRVFVVHGEELPAARFRDRLESAGFRDVAVPVFRQRFDLQ
jgi:metallo-beta-lactamase family protein